jgi:hypothetical protein
MTWTPNPARYMDGVWITIRTCGEYCRSAEFYCRNAGDKMIELLRYSRGVPRLEVEDGQAAPDLRQKYGKHTVQLPMGPKQQIIL